MLPPLSPHSSSSSSGYDVDRAAPRPVAVAAMETWDPLSPQHLTGCPTGVMGGGGREGGRDEDVGDREGEGDLIALRGTGGVCVRECCVLCYFDA